MFFLLSTITNAAPLLLAQFFTSCFPPTPSRLYAGDHSSFCLKCFSFSVFQNLTGSLLLHAEQGGTADSFFFFFFPLRK